MVEKKKAENKVKKAASKQATKKKTVKKASKAAAKKSVKQNAPTEQCFIMVDGHKLKNVKELADVMEKIEDHVFHHHVTNDRNDFANWLRDVFKEIDLAAEVSGCRDKHHVQLVLYKHISHKLW